MFQGRDFVSTTAIGVSAGGIANKHPNQEVLMISRRLSVVATAAMYLLSFAPAFGQAVSSEKFVATIVIAKRPPNVPRDRIDQLIVASVPTYQKIPGLIRKFFTVNDDSYGGMYLWSDRKAAEAWFTPQWASQIKDRTGAEPSAHLLRFTGPDR